MSSRSKILSPGVCLALVVLLSLGFSVARADVASVQAEMDTTIFDENEVGGDLSNGAGSYIFAGTNGPGGARQPCLRVQP